jgi:DNA-binding GntR family transcriptional regulator
MSQPRTSIREFARLKSKTLSTQAFEVLRDAMFSGRLHPGDELREVALAQELGVSQNTIREALLQLEKIGLVVRNRNRNTVVTRLTPEDVAERVAMRLLVEPPLCAEASQLMTGDDIATLRMKSADISTAVDANQPFAAALADLEFHRFLWERSGNRWLYQILDQTTLPLFAFISIVRYQRSQHLIEFVNPHDELIAAVESRNRKRIADSIRKHIQSSYEEFVPPGTSYLEPL